MNRGNIITVVIQGDYGKPRPALVIQKDSFNALNSITVLPITTTIIDAPLIRITVHPSSKNGLNKLSQIMIDKIITIKKDKIGEVIGTLEQKLIKEVERNLAVFIGIA